MSVRRNLGCDPGDETCEGGRQGFTDTEDPFEARKGDLYTLPGPVLLGLLSHQPDAQFSQLALKGATLESEIPKTVRTTSRPRLAPPRSSSVRLISATFAEVSS